MRKLLVFMAATLLVAACSPAGSEESATTSVPDATTSTMAPTTTTSTTLPATTTTQASTSTTEADPLAADGSGCAPETAELPDGEWYGLVAAFDSAAITFDLACWFSGEAAEAAATEDEEESPPPNDYYVRNENEEIRVLAVAPSVPVTWYPSGDPNDVVNGTFTEWTEYLEGREFRLGIWVTIAGGQATEIEEVWVP